MKSGVQLCARGMNRWIKHPCPRHVARKGERGVGNPLLGDRVNFTKRASFCSGAKPLISFKVPLSKTAPRIGRSVSLPPTSPLILAKLVCSDFSDRYVKSHIPRLLNLAPIDRW